MRVKLRNQLFIDNRLFERGEHPNFPDELKKHLPSSAVQLDKLSEPVADADPRADDRADGDSLNQIEGDAEARRLANAKKIRDRLAAETGKK